jgi:hypothetical protein
MYMIIAVTTSYKEGPVIRYPPQHLLCISTTHAVMVPPEEHNLYYFKESLNLQLTKGYMLGIA